MHGKIRTMALVGVALLAGALFSGADAKDPAPAAAAAEPLRAELGQPAPDFKLTDLDGKEHRLSDYEGRIVVLEWFNPDCPFVKKHHAKNKTMATTFASAKDSRADSPEVVWLAINSGGEGKQGHGAERNRKAVEDYGMRYPVLLDADGKVGRMYEAKTTPHMYVVGTDGILVYRGAIDDNPSPGTLGETNYVAGCLTSLLAGESPEPMETKSYGCSVKYSAAEKKLP